MVAWRRLPLLLILGFVLGGLGVALVSRALRGAPEGKRFTVTERVARHGAAAEERLLPSFREKGVPVPPSALTLIGLKSERVLEVWARGPRGPFRKVRSYPFTAASGTLGPKLREGDEQVPEGLYRITFLNPNSLFHLSLRVGYPNDFDREMGRRDGRRSLGGDIMIHGNAVSIGCIAVGDEAAEDLFVLAARTGLSRIRVILSPVDFRRRPLPDDVPSLPPWAPELYRRIRAELESYRE
jgi:hypothetical protein